VTVGAATVVLVSAAGTLVGLTDSAGATATAGVAAGFGVESPDGHN
jgi:hypothetical protein